MKIRSRLNTRQDCLKSIYPPQSPARLFARLEDRRLFDATAIVDLALDVSNVWQNPFAPEIWRKCDFGAFSVQPSPTTQSTIDEQLLPKARFADSLEAAPYFDGREQIHQRDFAPSKHLLLPQLIPDVNVYRNEVVFVDAGVADHELIVDALQQRGMVTVLIQPDQDGVVQIAEAMASRDDVDGLHIISHGNSAELYLGNATLSIVSMFGEHAEALAGIKSALSGSADILVYGCEFGTGAAGQIASAILADAIQADIATSIDRTGHHELGGDSVVGNDAIQVALNGGQSAAENSLGEAGLLPSAISQRYFLASTSSGVYEDVVLSGATQMPDPDPQTPLDTFESTPSGLLFRIVEQGSGARPTATDTVTVHYRGWLPEPSNPDVGIQFDSFFDRGRPSTFSLQNVIQGWTEGLQLVREGGTIELEVPPELGYGSTGSISGSVPPNATMRFFIELIEIA